MKLSFAVGDYRAGQHYLVHHRYGTLAEAEQELDKLRAGEVLHRLTGHSQYGTPGRLAREARIVVEAHTVVYSNADDERADYRHFGDRYTTLCGVNYDGRASATGYEPVARVDCPHCLALVFGAEQLLRDVGAVARAGVVEASS